MVRGMKTIVSVLLGAVCALSLSSCALTSEKYSKNQAATTAYLQQNKSTTRTNVEGIWYAPEWGIVALNQTPGGTITGGFQDWYAAQGSVSGKNVRLALMDNSWTEYTMELTRVSNEHLKGSYSPSVPFSAKNAKEVNFVKIGQ